MMPAPLASALTTTPNAGLPAGFRRRSSPNGDEKLSAAGILFVTPDGDGLFVKRKGGDHAGEWSIPAGRIEQDEEPEHAARREAVEEIGTLGDWGLAPLDRRLSDDGVDFVTFGQQRDRFDPVLNDEHDEYVWAPLGEPPEPLHPGLRHTLARFFEEEAEERGHRSEAATELANEFAGDSALRMALDRASVRSYDVDGHLHVEEANLCQARVDPYKGSEIPGYDEESGVHALGLDPEKTYMMFRPPWVLEKAVSTINGKPLLREHKPTNAEDHQRNDVVGSIGTTARWEAPFIKDGLTIWCAEDIEGIETKEKYQLSPGYHYDPIMEPGAWQGEPYDGWMDNIIFNHVAIVEEGRQGESVVIGDTVAEMQWAMIKAAFKEFIRA
jgi:uncharacterized protein